MINGVIFTAYTVDMKNSAGAEKKHPASNTRRNKCSVNIQHNIAYMINLQPIIIDKSVKIISSMLHLHSPQKRTYKMVAERSNCTNTTVSYTISSKEPNYQRLNMKFFRVINEGHNTNT